MSVPQHVLGVPKPRLRDAELVSPTASAGLPTIEHVFKDKPCPAGNLFVREDLGAKAEDLCGVVQHEVRHEEADVLGVSTSCRENLHGKQMLRGRRRDPQARAIEDSWCLRIPANGDVRARLFVEPPLRQP
ncbi:hypothetical protein AB0C15_07495 [Micromonospora sp. NPDC048835]|uniref:hypothetical protein n=1 Tax=Micromonospora sp. NPDC048835 TaxID=3155147 RepID=UPI0033E3474E